MNPVHFIPNKKVVKFEYRYLKVNISLRRDKSICHLSPFYDISCQFLKHLRTCSKKTIR